MYANEMECIAADLDVERVEPIAKRISKAAREAEKIGVKIFGGSGSGTLRFFDQKGIESRPLVVAHLDGNIDGGDGSTREDSAGLLRGE